MIIPSPRLTPVLGARDLPRAARRRVARRTRQARPLFDRVSSFVRGRSRPLPVVVKTGGAVDRVDYQLDKLDTVRTAPFRWPTAPTRRSGGLDGDRHAGQEKFSGRQLDRARLLIVQEVAERVGRDRRRKNAARRRRAPISPRTCGAQANAPVDGTPDADSDPPAEPSRILAEASADAAPDPAPFPPDELPSTVRARGPVPGFAAGASRRPRYDRRHAHGRRAPRGVPMFFESKGHLRRASASWSRARTTTRRS